MDAPTYAAVEGPAQAGCGAMERVGSRGTPQGRWRKGSSGRISRQLNGRAVKGTVQKMKFRYRRFYVDKKETVGGKNEIFISIKDSSFGDCISIFCSLFTFI